jgi:hypothetical protein
MSLVHVVDLRPLLARRADQRAESHAQACASQKQPEESGPEATYKRVCGLVCVAWQLLARSSIASMFADKFAPGQGRCVCWCMCVLLRWMESAIDWARTKEMSPHANPATVAKSSSSTHSRAKDCGVRTFAKKPHVSPPSRTWLAPDQAVQPPAEHAPPVGPPDWLAHYTLQCMQLVQGPL